MTKVYIANNEKALEELNLDYTVEAEFGEFCVEGKLGTLAHHGPRAGNPCPCMAKNLPTLSPLSVGISHMDLDTLGGLLAVLGQKPEGHDEFWRVAAEVDVRGVHHLEDITLDPDIIDRLNAYWAFSETNRVYAPRDGSALEVSSAVDAHVDAITEILDGDATLLDAGRQWAASKEALARDSLIEEFGGVVLRRSEEFVNHLYDGCACVVAFNPRVKSVTVSLADPVDGVSCREIVQKLWGPEAGGHDGIAGSPRGQEMTNADAVSAFREMIARLST